MSAMYMPKVEESRGERVTFATAHGLMLAGHVYRARGSRGGEVAPGVVMAGPMTSVKEETLPHYAAALQDSGYTVLTFDNRNFGECDGVPRSHPDTYEQVEDLKNAITLHSISESGPWRWSRAATTSPTHTRSSLARMDWPSTSRA